MYIQRQISAVVGQGQVETLPELSVFPFKMRDVLPKFSLVVGDGEYTSGQIRLDASDSYSVPLPAGYSNTARLSCIFRANSVCKVVIVSPDHGTSTILLKGTNGTTNGEHHGILMWQGTVTSITVSVAAAGDSTLIDYFLFEIPDLTDPDSWRLGARAIGNV